MTIKSEHETQDENRILNICNRVPSALSVLCSAYIIYSVTTCHQKLSSPTQRIVLGMSFADIVFSVFMFLGSWPLPHDTENAYGAVGNTQTCTMQGFFLQLGGLMTPMYNGLLALYCFLYICRDWSRQRMKQVELVGHSFVIVFALSLAIAYIPMELYNPHGIVCWVEPFPNDCTQSFQSPDGTTDCIRGDNAYIQQYFVNGAILWINFSWACVSMVKVYLHIRNQEKKMATYTSQFATSTTTSTSSGGTTRSSNSDSRDVAIRGVLFTGAFLLTFLPPTIAHSIEYFEEHSFPAEIVEVLFLPCQGIFNLLVYIIHPQVRRYLQEKANRGRRRRMVDTTLAVNQQQQQTAGCEFDISNTRADESSRQEKLELSKDFPIVPEESFHATTTEQNQQQQTAGCQYDITNIPADESSSQEKVESSKEFPVVPGGDFNTTTTEEESNA